MDSGSEHHGMIHPRLKGDSKLFVSNNLKLLCLFQTSILTSAGPLVSSGHCCCCAVVVCQAALWNHGVVVSTCDLLLEDDQYLL